MALLDLSCAFDTVDHVTLLPILSQRLSVTDQAFAWFQSYLTDRCQVFTTDSTQSAPIALSSGIPQGSGLGPTQFIAYTDDTTNIVPSHNIQYHLFADDSHMVTAQFPTFQTSSAVFRHALRISLDPTHHIACC